MAVVTVAALIIAGIAIGEVPTDVLIRNFPIISILINLAFYSITILTQWRVYKRDDLRFGERKNQWSIPKLAVFAALAFAASILLNWLILSSPLPELFPSYEQAAAESFAGQPWPLLIITVVVIGPIAEELIFRGLIYDRLRHYVKVPLAVIISAALFGLYHGNVIQFIYTFVMGALLAMYYEKSGGLLACIIAHMAMNAFAVTSFL